MSSRRFKAISQVALFACAALGLGVSALLLWEYLAESAGVCGPGGGCDVIRQSRFASFFGIPTPAFGVAFFAGLLFLLSLGGRAGRLVPWFTGGGAAAGLALLGVQAFALEAFCRFCVIADVASIAALGAVLLSRGAPPWGGRERAIATAGAGAGAAAFLVVGVLAAGPAIPEGVELLEELPAPVAQEQQDGVVTVVEFVDFKCPHCQRLHRELDEAIEPYRDKVRVVRKPVPLTGHPEALPAAIAACCAEEAGRGEEMADALFENDQLHPEACEELAEDLGADMEVYRSCARSDETIEQIKDIIAQAKEAGVRGLPTFFIDRERFEGERPAKELRASLERALRRRGI